MEQGRNTGNWTEYGARYKKNDGHALCVVGYDDEKSYGGYKGFLKVMNSWGSAWGDGDFLWIAYDLVRAGKLLEAYAVYDLGPDVEPSGAGSVCKGGSGFSLTNALPSWQVSWYASGAAQVAWENGSLMRAEPRQKTSGKGQIAAYIRVEGEWGCQASIGHSVWVGLPILELCLMEDGKLSCSGGVGVELEEYARASVRDIAQVHARGGMLESELENSKPQCGGAWLMGMRLCPYALQADGTVVTLTCSNTCGTATASMGISVRKRDRPPYERPQIVAQGAGQ